MLPRRVVKRKHETMTSRTVFCGCNLRFSCCFYSIDETLCKDIVSQELPWFNATDWVRTCKKLRCFFSLRLKKDSRIKNQDGVMDLVWTWLNLHFTPACTNYPPPLLSVFHCSKCGTLPPESCFFSLICSTGSFMGKNQCSSIHTDVLYIAVVLFYTCLTCWLNEALCT